MVLAGWDNMDAALGWSGLEREAWQAVARGLGDPELQELMIVASVEQTAMTDATNGATVEGMPLSPIVKAKVMLTINAVRAKFGATPLAPAAPQAQAAAITTAL